MYKVFYFLKTFGWYWTNVILVKGRIDCYRLTNETKQTSISHIPHAEFQGNWDLGFSVKMLIVNGM